MQIPADIKDLQAEVSKLAGVRSALAIAARDRKAPMTGPKQERAKKKRKLNMKHITNTHLAHVIADSQFTSID